MSVDTLAFAQKGNHTAMANTMISELHCRAMYSIQYNTVKPIIFAALNFGGSVYYIISAPLILEFLMGSIRDVLVNGVISNIRGLLFSQHAKVVK